MCVVGFATAEPGVRSPNVLVIIADDLGVDRVGAYGEHPAPGKTPNIDALARDGVLFRNVWSNPSCSPTRATLLTGKYSFRTGVGRIVQTAAGDFGLDATQMTLPRGARPRLLDGGFREVASRDARSVAAAPVGRRLRAPRRHAVQPRRLFPLDKHTNGEAEEVERYATTDTTDAALLAMESLSEPWLLWVAYNAPHAPLHAPPDALHSRRLAGDPGRSPVEHFKAAVEAMDTEIGD